MGRRRRREPGISDIIGPIAGLVILVVMFASLGGKDLFGGVLQDFFALITGVFLIVLIIAVVGIIGYFVLKSLSQKNTRPMYHESIKLTPLTFGEPSPPKAESVVDKLRATDWYQFEKVVGLVYESQGYRLSRRGGANPDGGIDLLIEKDGERAAVQCKRWKKWKVDVPKVRELFGAMTHEGIPHGVIVALNGFTLEAKQLAVEHNIDIIPDENLAAMIAGLAPESQRKVLAMLDDETKHCPKCEATMVWRTPKPGKNWTPFWGCFRYPQCHGRLQDD